MVGPLGLLVSNLCIIRYLAAIVTPNKSMESRSEGKRRIVGDYSLSFGGPFIVAASSVVYHTARYQVFNLSGCVTVSVLTWPNFILSLIWPLILCGVACGYSRQSTGHKHHVGVSWLIIIQ